ncbi:Plasmid recombination enzyme [Thiohalospira halophila DSM 15071]|uniref:Plasmid recombination enzyme n=1 Tax=Thiohalospira halophila DSM 15071 TaxID=1123397 RepID=A0A1I1WNV7_9GAMM|nr:plasmid recombination protein [Thiohalospira halophila]SFD95103.1 Plasmid recombination enzyme [Thiohalospira halophila DSM 15071]
MAAEQKAVSVRVERMTRNEYRHQRAHDTRTAIPAYADAERVHLNRVLVEYPDTNLMVEGIQASRRNRHRRGETRRAPTTLRKDGVVGVKGILTFSHEAQPIIKELSTAEQDRLYRKAADAVAAEFNASLVGLVVHADEQAPHAHFVLPGFDQKGRPLSERMTDSLYSHLQDVVGV